MKRKITVKAPATTANLGPSFDCLGLALTLYCSITIEESEKNHFIVTGEGKGQIQENEDNLVYQVIKAFTKKFNIELPPLAITIENEIPIKKGLGSSAAAIVAALSASYEFFEKKKPETTEERSEFLSLAGKFEQHPDNLSACYLGGIVLSGTVPERKTTLLYAFDNYKKEYQKTFREKFENNKVVAAIPEFEIKTDSSRKNLLSQKNDSLSHEDYIKGLNQAIANILSLSTGMFQNLRHTMKDTVWHQEQRKKDIPFFDDTISAAMGSEEKGYGAYGAALSGSGPTIIAISPEHKAETVGKSMCEAITKHNIKCSYKTLEVDFEGAKIVS